MMGRHEEVEPALMGEEPHGPRTFARGTRPVRPRIVIPVP